MNAQHDSCSINPPPSANGYKFVELLGSGAFATVFKAIQIKSGHEFAAKIIHCLPKNNKTYQQFTAEIGCLVSLLHPNVIKIYDTFREGDYLFLILELCNKGSINDILERGEKFNTQQIIMIMKQLLNAIKYCHSQGIAHRDIKPANIVESDNGVFKLTDFGISIQMENKETLRNFDGSFAFKAPELLKKEEHCPFKADIWSLGVTFFIIATGRLPWMAIKSKIEKTIIAGVYSFPMDTPEPIKRVISQMLIVDPSKRATPEQLLNEKCFESVSLTPSLHQRTNKKVNAPMNIRHSSMNYRSTSMARNGLHVLKRGMNSNPERKIVMPTNTPKNVFIRVL